MAYQDEYTNFLLELDRQRNKIIYAKITALNNEELPIETIEGRITQGSVNIDGASAVRRTCSLTMVSQNYDYSNYVWGINTKFKLEIGVENVINQNYPNIIWFPQGVFVLTSINISKTTNNFTLSLQGKDKMCLLNGEIGGTLESSVDFGTIQEENRKGEWTIRKITIPEIIRNAVHTYGGEPYHNIIINDLDTYGLELLEYRYDSPMYMYRKQYSEQYSNILMESDCLTLYDKENREFQLKDLTADYLESLTDTFINDEETKSLYTEPYQVGQAWKFTKINYGQTAGYRLTDLTYAGDLIANVGESITSILDKIRNMLTEFEYFYNLDGQFVFQKKQSFVSTMWNKTNLDNQMDQYGSLSKTTAYNFTNFDSITTFNNNPNLLNMRNDYIIWGERTSASGATLSIHLRFAIDKKIKTYKQIHVTEKEIEPYNKKYDTLLKSQENQKTFIATDGSYSASGNIVYCDWREILYQMALDYFKYNHLDDFELKVAIANPDLYPTGQTGYEQYYTDIQGFWRQLFNPDIDESLNNLQDKISGSQANIRILNDILYDKKDNNGIKSFGLISDISAFTEATNTYSALPETPQSQQAPTFRIKIKNLLNKYKDQCEYKGNIDNEIWSSLDDIAYRILSNLQDYYKKCDNNLIAETNILENLTKELELIQNNSHNFYTEGKNIYWCKDVFEAPDALNFWFDFLDQEGELDKFNVKVVGSRPKTINDSLVKSIYFRETPPVIFQEADNALENLSGYKTIQIENIESMFTISAQGKSAKDRLDELLYAHGYCVDNVTITTIPIYYLQPNSRIHVIDHDTKLEGDYIISKISLPLAYNGTMQITATKAVENLI